MILRGNCSWYRLEQYGEWTGRANDIATRTYSAVKSVVFPALGNNYRSESIPGGCVGYWSIYRYAVVRKTWIRELRHSSRGCDSVTARCHNGLIKGNSVKVVRKLLQFFFLLIVGDVERLTTIGTKLPLKKKGGKRGGGRCFPLIKFEQIFW